MSKTLTETWDIAPLVEQLQEWRDRGIGFDTNPTIMGGDAAAVTMQLYTYIKRMDEHVRATAARVLEAAAEHEASSEEPLF